MSRPAASASAALPLPDKPVCGRDGERHMRIWRGADTAAQGGPWVCGLCHPPAKGLHVEWTDGRTEIVTVAARDQTPETVGRPTGKSAEAAEAAPEPVTDELPVTTPDAPTLPVEAPAPPLAAVTEAQAPEAPSAPVAAVPAPVAAEDGEVGLDRAIARHGDAHLCEIEGEGWIECPEDDCDRPDHDCRVQRAMALDAAA